MSKRASSLVATIGSEPQVVTLAADELLHRGEPLSRVFVLHTNPTTFAIHDALSALETEFGSYPAYSGLRLEFIPITANGQPLSDITTPAEAQILLSTTYRHIASLKEAGSCVHLCAAGGRKIMAMYAMLVAQLLFDPNDRLWVLVSTEELRLQRQLHARLGEASLVRVPVLPWRLGLTEKQDFVRHDLTPAETEVLELVAKGLTNREIARERATSDKTVDHQLSAIYNKLRVFLGYRDDVRIDRHILAAEFSAYFDVVDALTLGTS